MNTVTAIQWDDPHRPNEGCFTSDAPELGTGLTQAGLSETFLTRELILVQI